MTARDYLMVLRKGWIIIVASGLLGAVVAGLVLISEAPEYRASSTLAVSACVVAEFTPACDPVGGMSYAVQRAGIYSEAGGSVPVLRRAMDLTDGVSTLKSLSTQVSVTQVLRSPLIEVNATGSDPEEAADMANAVGQALIEYARGSIDDFESGITTVDFIIVSEAAPAAAPVNGDTRIIVLASLFGLVAGLGIAFLAYFADPRLRSREDAETLSGLDVVGELLLRKSSTTFDSLSVENLDSYRRLRSAVCVRAESGNVRSLLVISPSDREESWGVALGLATSMAESGKRVALVDLKLVDGLHEAPEMPATGLVGILAGGLSVHEALHQVDGSTLHILPAGSGTSEAASLLAAPKLDAVVVELLDHFDFVVLDAAPMLSTAAGITAARLADGALVVAGIGVTRRRDLAETFRTLELVETVPVGIAAVF
ncbi:polysaccharide biosynthesis tyrosine autokinase [Cryobacterium sp. Y50]|uniref:polysaccharide biosynthesis tyrosine autokinase n=1 Tax=Cryobacterium sp. Y50 TaxID=2048286 RepID=UPI000CE3F03C|nr:polysaccharide biosynthesis tyrosine autokinase [Cryobacterium sp. Y50]